MSKKAIEMLNQSVEEFISIHSLLSTGINREYGRVFLSRADSFLIVEPVFVEIDTDPRLNNIEPFSGTTSSSNLHDEEVLSMVRSIFRFVRVKRDDGDII